MSMVVAQIGLGAIGSIYTGHLRKAGIAVTAFDKDATRLEGARGLGAIVAASLREAVAGASHVLVSLPDPPASQAALMGDDGVIANCAKGALILDVSTIDPGTARALFAAAKQRGIDYLEAPVSGGEPMSAGTDGARNANVTFMVGGERAAFDRAVPLMKVLGQHPLYLGEAGVGALVKLISNHQAGLINLLNAEAFAIGRAAGIEPEMLFKVFNHTDASSFWLHNYFAPRIRSGNFEPGFSVDLQYKDHRLLDDVVRELKVPTPFNAMALQFYQILRARGDGGKDLVEAANLFAEFAGVKGFDAE